MNSMRSTFFLIVFALALATTARPAVAGKDVSDYLTADGLLKEVLELRDVQGGFAGFTGSLWKVEKDGQWKKFQVFNQKLTEKEQGQLNKEQLANLAKTLAQYNLANLANEGKVAVNPHVVQIGFGKLKANLNLGAGQALPAADPATVTGRFGGIAQAVQAMLKGKKSDS
jgi:hypothetical protein